MPRVRLVNKYLVKRPNSSVYWFRVRVPKDVQRPGEPRLLQESTGQRDVKKARRFRDQRLAQLQQHWEEFRNGSVPLLNTDPLVLDALKSHREEQGRFTTKSEPGVSHSEFLVDVLERRLSDFMSRMGPKEALAFEQEYSKEDALEELASQDPKAAALLQAIKVADGALPITVAGEVMLQTARNKHGELVAESTKDEYRRAYARAEEVFGTTDCVTPEGARRFIQDLAASGLAEKTVRNVQTALTRLWGHQGLSKSIWSRDFDVDYVPSKDPPRVAWTEDDIRLLYASCTKPWLVDVMVIAAHTGMRQEEIVGFDFVQATGLISIAREHTKTPAGVRRFFPPAYITPAILRWRAKPRSKSSVANEFGKLSRSLGYGKHTGKVFHSFRNWVIQRLAEKKTYEAHMAWTVGHEIDASIAPSLSMYGSADAPETFRDVLEQLPMVLPEGWED